LIRLYRILRRRHARAPFDGEGAFRYGGRWSSPGVRLAYTSEHVSLAMIEYFVHLDADDPPPDLVVATADVPDDLSRAHVPTSRLPDGWQRTPAPGERAALGDRFARRGRHAALVVPSGLAPSESNWLLNPTHADFARLRIRPLEPFAYDVRFFA
jgi:RES domain-containing protein